MIKEQITKLLLMGTKFMAVILFLSHQKLQVIIVLYSHQLKLEKKKDLLLYIINFLEKFGMNYNLLD